ncbi:MAG: hypothetical protein ABSG04_12110 [Verrucomicrobiota bacterium]|jgi:hypothetical protein
MKIKKTTIRKAMAATAQELNVQCLRMAVERSENALRDQQETMYRLWQRRAGQLAELRVQEAILAARKGSVK